MKNFKSFIQLDEVERVKYKDGIANKMAYANDEVKTKGHRLDNKQAFGEGDAYDKDVKASPKPNDKEAAAQRAKLAALAARKAMDAAKKRGALKNEDVDLLSDLYDQLDESNQEIFLAQLEEDAEVLLAFAKTIAEE